VVAEETVGCSEQCPTAVIQACRSFLRADAGAAIIPVSADGVFRRFCQRMSREADHGH
jgi:hypothetical protein